MACRPSAEFEDLLGRRSRRKAAPREGTPHNRPYLSLSLTSKNKEGFAIAENGAVKVGIIGCGKISGIYLENAPVFDDIEVVACSRPRA